MNEQHPVIGEKGMQKGKRPESLIIIIFGASGDLAHRQLLPSLYALEQKKLLPEKFAIVGFDKVNWNDESYREEMHEKICRKNLLCDR